jgi:ATP-binding cassette, subfamily G (WHITE), member 2, PDR
MYLAELDVHFPELTLGETLSFAAATQERGPHRNVIARQIGKSVAGLFSLSDSLDTKMGNTLIRGVSGGEKRRVSLAEAFMTGSVIQCWDNSTRGMDSSTALEFLELLRSSTTKCGLTLSMSMYQASEAMYEVRFIYSFDARS